MDLRKFFLYTLIISVVVSALLGIGVILFGKFGDFETRVLMTTSTITITSILGLACGARFELGRGRVLPLTGIGLSIIAAILCIVMIWVRGSSEDLGKTTLSAAMLATVCAHLSLVSIAWLDARFKWSYYLLWIADWILNSILLYILWFSPDGNSDLVPRLIGVLSIVIAALTIMTPIFHKLSRKPVETVEDIDAEIAVLRSRIEKLDRRKAELI